MQTRLTNLLGIQYPIVQGGLAYLAVAPLAAAASCAGALGQITATTLSGTSELADQIRQARTLTERPFGVNFVATQRLPVAEMIRVAVEMNVPVLSFAGGDPAPFLLQLDGTNVRKLVAVANVRQAQLAESLGADAVIAIGAEAGGHIGRDDLSTLVLVSRLAESVSVPVVAAGGIATGAGLAAALALGAEGIAMGTRFVATVECPAHEQYKQLLVNSTEQDTLVINRGSGAAGRVVTTPWVRHVMSQINRRADPDEWLRHFRGRSNRAGAVEGDLEHGFVWGGQGLGHIKRTVTVDELIKQIIEEAAVAIARINRTVQPGK